MIAARRYYSRELSICCHSGMFYKCLTPISVLWFWVVKHIAPQKKEGSFAFSFKGFIILHILLARIYIFFVEFDGTRWKFIAEKQIEQELDL